MYPGGQFDPAGLSKGKDFETLKRKELANGRVAMLAFLGIMAQTLVNPGAGPVATPLATSPTRGTSTRRHQRGGHPVVVSARDDDTHIDDDTKHY